MFQFMHGACRGCRPWGPLFCRFAGVALAALGTLLAASPAVFAEATAVGTRGMVVSAEARATDAGVQILRSGGNAFDAAAAVGFALGVTHGIAGSLGGGGFAVAITAEGEALALDFRETAPRAAHRDLFLDDGGEPIPGASLRSARASGVPGTADGLLRLQRDHGVLARADVMAPAIALARDGVPVSSFLAGALLERREDLAPFDATRAVFFGADGGVLREGDLLVQADLARTLERIAAEGRDGFYAGETAARIIAAMEAAGGILDAADLGAYRSRWRPPLRFERWGDEFVTHPLPSSGGVTLGQILGLLDRDALQGAAFQSAEYVRQLVEAERIAYADRNHHLGDPGFVDPPVARLLSEDYLATRRRLIPAHGAGRSADVSPGRPEPDETTNFCVADAAGNVVVITMTLNQWFGTGALVAGAGIFLNNEMDDFSVKPGVPNLYGLVGGEANAIAPGKKPLSSMTPTIVRRNGRLLLAIGSPGGSTIITTVLQVYLNVALWGMDLAGAIDAPRFHHQWLPDRIFAEEDALAGDVRVGLEDMGYGIAPRRLGRATGIVRLPGGALEGHADRRVSSGKAAAE